MPDRVLMKSKHRGSPFAVPALGVYISIPFCRAKCSYCNFASGVFGSERMTAYVEKLVADIRKVPERTATWRTAEQCPLPGFVSGHDFSGAANAEKNQWASVPASISLPTKIDSLYFGGGTPSLLSPKQMREILHALHDVFSIDSAAEITLECAPGQLSDDLLQAMPDLGFNRISLGVQSFVDSEAAAVGRLHTRAIALKEIERLRHAGIEDINVDLIAGLPHQTPHSWNCSLAEAIATRVPHISVYMLDVDEDSRLGREMIAGGMRYGAAIVPNEQAITAMYTEACDQFAAANIAQYEISNFARAGHRSRHNMKYWTRQPYLGLGLDAHSFLPATDGSAVRVGITDDLATYLDPGGDEREMIAAVSVQAALEEAWFLGLRLNEGVSLNVIEREFGEATVLAVQPILVEAQQQGLIEYDQNRARLTDRGRLFSNEVFTRFLGAASLPQPASGMLQEQGASV